jgi:hypothetical protein
VPSKAFEWSNGTYSLLLDTDEELDFAELLLDTLVSLSLDFGVTLDDERTLLLDCGVTLDEDFALLLDTLVSPSLDCGVTSSILLDDSSSRGAKLLSSSPHAARKNVRASTVSRYT